MRNREHSEELRLFEHARKEMHYDLFSGAFYWIKGRKRVRGPDKLLVKWTKGVNRYSNRDVLSKDVLAHRLSWFMMYGEIPANDIDHVNGDRSDNRIENLRSVSKSENLLNKKCHRDRGLHYTSKRTTKIKGVDYTYYASVINGKYLGTFKTRQEAHDRAVTFAKDNRIALLGVKNG